MTSDDRQPALDDTSTAALAAALAPVALAPARRAALRERVLARAVDRADEALMRVVRAGEGAWLDLLPGVSIKFLHLDAVGATQSSLWRLAPGAAIPPHGHLAEEECVVLEGTVNHAGQDYHRGDFLLARAGLQHAAFRSESGAVLYIRSELSAPLAALARGAGLL